MAFKGFQHAEAGTNLVVALRRGPAEVLADRLRQFVAAVVGQKLDGFLDVGDLPPRQASAGEGGRFKVNDSLVHDVCPIILKTSYESQTTC